MNKRSMYFISCVFVIFASSGCSPIETVRKIWGSSTQALDDARISALTKTFTCSFDECFEAVLGLQRPVEKWYDAGPESVLDKQVDKPLEDSPLLSAQGMTDTAAQDTGKFDIFIKNRIKRHIVVIGVPGNIETTEVGIFFTRLTPSLTKVEISSLSGSAKSTVAQDVFHELTSKYGEASE